MQEEIQTYFGMENVSFCPYRTSITYDWAAVQTTYLSQPVTFSGTPQDVQLLEACKEDTDRLETAELKIDIPLRKSS